MRQHLLAVTPKISIPCAWAKNWANGQNKQMSTMSHLTTKKELAVLPHDDDDDGDDDDQKPDN